VYVPRARQRVHVPASLEPVILGSFAVIATLLAWAALMARPTADESVYAVRTGDPAAIRAVAYSVPRTTEDGTTDEVYVRDLGDASAGRRLGSFTSVYGLHARGAASPAGDRLAVLHVTNPGAPAVLTLLAVSGNEGLDVDSGFDYLSPLAWSPDGSRLAATRTSPEGAVAVIEVDTASGVAVQAAPFPPGDEVMPVGYSMDGTKLYVVTIDQAGSKLWMVHGGMAEQAAFLSPGRTRDWALSADGARLAFVDLIGVGERTYAGRTLLIATGQVSDAAPAGDQLGTAWRPGSDIPDFGGPGGTLQLSDPDPGSYVIPMRWAPDGSTLVATIYSAGRDGGEPAESIELLSPVSRVRLSESPGAKFLGWVKDSP
jgi:WD40 repeat protein